MLYCSRWQTLISLSGRSEKEDSTVANDSTRNWWVPGTSALCSTIQSERDLEKGQQFHFTSMNYHRKVRRFRSRFTDPTYYLKVFPENLMSSCRSLHESHACSEFSYRIVRQPCKTHLYYTWQEGKSGKELKVKRCKNQIETPAPRLAINWRKPSPCSVPCDKNPSKPDSDNCAKATMEHIDLPVPRLAGCYQ